MIGYMSRNDAKRRIKALQREYKILAQDLEAMQIRLSKLESKSVFTELEESHHERLCLDIEELKGEMEGIKEDCEALERNFLQDDDYNERRNGVLHG